METKKNATAEDQLQINKFARLHKIFMENKVNFNFFYKWHSSILTLNIKIKFIIK